MKYAFTGETREAFGTTLLRIKRLCDGLVGGWIESEENLSQEGICFVYNEACVFGKYRVSGSIQIYDTEWMTRTRIPGIVRISEQEHSEQTTTCNTKEKQPKKIINEIKKTQRFNKHVTGGEK